MNWAHLSILELVGCELNGGEFGPGSNYRAYKSQKAIGICGKVAVFIL